MQVPRQWLFPRPGDRQGKFAVLRLLHGAHSARCVNKNFVLPASDLESNTWFAWITVTAC